MRRDIVLLYAALLLRYAAPLVLVPYYGRYLGGEAYGQLLSAMALSQVVWVLIEWGLPLTGIRDVAVMHQRQERAKLLSAHSLARTLLALLVVPCAAVAVWFSPVLRTDSTTAWLSICSGAISAYNLTWYFQGRQRMRLPALIELVGLAISSGVILSVVNVPGDVWKVPLTLALVGLASNVVQSWAAAQDGGWPAPSLPKAWQLLRLAFPLFTVRGLGMLLGPTAVLAVGSVTSVAAAGTFALAERLSAIVVAFVSPLNQVFSGAVYRAAGLETRDDIGWRTTVATIRRYALRVTAALTVLTITALLCADVLMPVILGPRYEYVVWPFRIACAASFLSTLGTIVVGYVLLPFKHDRAAAKVAAFSMVVVSLLTTAGALLADASGALVARVVAASLALLAALWAMNSVGLLQPFLSRQKQPREIRPERRCNIQRFR